MGCVRLQCLSSGSVDSNQEAKAHSMAPGTPNGWSDTLPQVKGGCSCGEG